MCHHMFGLEKIEISDAPSSPSWWLVVGGSQPGQLEVSVTMMWQYINEPLWLVGFCEVLFLRFAYCRLNQFAQPHFEHLRTTGHQDYSTQPDGIFDCARAAASKGSGGGFGSSASSRSRSTSSRPTHLSIPLLSVATTCKMIVSTCGYL